MAPGGRTCRHRSQSGRRKNGGGDDAEFQNSPVGRQTMNTHAVGQILTKDFRRLWPLLAGAAAISFATNFGILNGGSSLQVLRGPLDYGLIGTRDFLIALAA